MKKFRIHWWMVSIPKHEPERKSPYAYEQHLAELIYSNVKPDDYVFSMQSFHLEL